MGVQRCFTDFVLQDSCVSSDMTGETEFVLIFSSPVVGPVTPPMKEGEMNCFLGSVKMHFFHFPHHSKARNKLVEMKPVT